MLIPIHSIIDRITNSSTEIFTNYENSVQAGYDLIQEFIDTFSLGFEINAKDVVEIKLLPDFYYLCELLIDEQPEIEEALDIKYDPSFIKMKWKEKVDYLHDCLVDSYKPDWLQKAITYIKEIREHKGKRPLYNELTIIPKEEKYKQLVNSLEKFLLSPISESYYC